MPPAATGMRGAGVTGDGRWTGRRRGGVGDGADDPGELGRGTLGKVDERVTDLDDVADRAMQLGDPATPRGGDLDDGFVGLDRDERLVGHDAVADRDVPRDDLGLVQTFAQVGQDERSHAYSRTLRAAAAIRRRSGT